MLKSDEKYKDIPIIMFTAHGKGLDLERIVAKEFGADAYITKPLMRRYYFQRCRNYSNNLAFQFLNFSIYFKNHSFYLFNAPAIVPGCIFFRNMRGFDNARALAKLSSCNFSLLCSNLLIFSRKAALWPYASSPLPCASSLLPCLLSGSFRR